MDGKSGRKCKTPLHRSICLETFSRRALDMILGLVCLLPLLAAKPQDSFPITTDDIQEKIIYDVVIVGAGLSGLSAANELRRLEPNLSVLLLEARGQVGGRVRTRSMSTMEGDIWVDIGSQFVSRSDIDLLSLAQEHGISLYPQSTCGDSSLYLSGGVRKARCVYSHHYLIE
uniref:monoamine oxidase n=1 Tax=Heterorhabditis bacteriophora TaxID=37862 RepID=A0A1I7XP92_HETBA